MENVQQGAKRFINFNGQIQDADLPLFNASNRAFRYGDGLFETMRLHNGMLLHADLHAARLQAGMKILHFKNQDRLIASFLQEESYRLATASGILHAARIRFTVFRNDGGLYTPENDAFSFLIEIESLQNSLFTVNEKGLQVSLFTEIVLARNGISSLKTINSIPFVCAAIYKRDHNLDEVLLLNSDGNLVESSSSNVFLVKDNRFYTPSMEEGCTNGVMRRKVIEMLNEDGFKVFELAIPPQSMEEADEVFLTNAVQGIRWVAGYNQHRYFNHATKRLTAKLNERINFPVKTSGNVL